MAPKNKNEYNRTRRERRAAIKNKEAQHTAGEIKTLEKNKERSAEFNEKQRRKREKEKKRAQKRRKALNKRLPSSEEQLLLHRVALPNEAGNSCGVASRPTSTTLIEEDDNFSLSSVHTNGWQGGNDMDDYSCNAEATTELIETGTDRLLTDILLPKRIHSDPPKDSSKSIEEDNIVPKQDNVTYPEARGDAGTTTGRKRTKAPPSLLSPRTIQRKTEVISDSPCVQLDKRQTVQLSLIDPTTMEVDSTPITNVIRSYREVEAHFILPSEFLDETATMLNDLANENKVDRSLNENGLIIRLSTTGSNLMSDNLLHECISGHDIHQLLTPRIFLTDAPINCYRLLLMREELKRAQQTKNSFNRAFIHSTVFWVFLCPAGIGKKVLAESDFDNARRVDRHLIGK